MIAVYARQSVDKKDSISIETQIQFCKYECRGELFKTYVDKGFSGKNVKRPAFSQMIQEIQSGMIKKVIVYKLDRISRSLIDFTQMMALFQKNHVEFISAQEKFDTSIPIGNAMLNITMIFAQLERETIQQRVKDNYYARVKKGYAMGGPVPYGFKKIEINIEGKRTSSYIEQKETSEIVKDMFFEYAYKNKSLGSIAEKLFKKGIKTPKGRHWNSNAVSRILHNPVYVKADKKIYEYYKNNYVNVTNEKNDFIGENGCYFYGKRTSNERKYTNLEQQFLTIAPHKGFIDSITFLKCQDRLKVNAQIKNSGKGKHTWLTGITKCGKCGYAMCVVSSKVKEGKLFYFTCKGKTANRCEGHYCTYKMIEIENAVKNEWIKLLKNQDFKWKKEIVDNWDKISFEQKVLLMQFFINKVIFIDEVIEIQWKYSFLEAI